MSELCFKSIEFVCSYFYDFKVILMLGDDVLSLHSIYCSRFYFLYFFLFAFFINLLLIKYIILCLLKEIATVLLSDHRKRLVFFTEQCTTKIVILKKQKLNLFSIKINISIKLFSYTSASQISPWNMVCYDRTSVRPLKNLNNRSVEWFIR